jgi:hypothetical protein
MTATTQRVSSGHEEVHLLTNCCALSHMLSSYHVMPSSSTHTRHKRTSAQFNTPLLDAKIPVGLVRNSMLPSTTFQHMTLDRMGVTEFFHVDHNVVLSGEVGMRL